jgi:phenylacetic acid degradation operon negative regulatory protein
MGVGSAVTARQGALHMQSARSALLTVLSVFVYPEPRPVPTAVFLHVLQLFGFDAKAGRQALRRAATAGWIESEKVGRKAIWRMTPGGHRLMVDGERRLKGLARAEDVWDGRFVVLQASVPDANRALRHTLRTRLSWLGFGAMGPGAWISIRLSAEREAAELLTQLGISDSLSLVAKAGLIGDFQQVVERAWDLAAVDRQYRSFVAEFEGLRPAAGDATVHSLVQMVHRWRRFPFIDPSLPPDLLPAGWSGIEAARMYRSLSALWTPTGRSRWRELIDADLARVAPDA